MIRSSTPLRAISAKVFNKRAGAALMAGAMLVGLGAVSPAVAGGPAYSQGFIAVAGPVQAAVDKAKKAPGDAAALADLKTKIAGVLAAAKTPDDQFAAGNLAIQVGGMAQDTAIQRQGVALMLSSGKASPDLQPRLHFYAGQFAFEAKEYAAARTELQAAVSAGYPDPEAEVLIAESFFHDKQDKDGLPHLVGAIAKQNAAKQPVPESWYRRALGAAYNVQAYDVAVAQAGPLLAAYPTKENWSIAISVVRDLGHLPSTDSIDLLRLMARTNSFAEERDYVEFVQAADPRQNPNEVKGIIERGVAAGMVTPSKEFFAEAIRISNARSAGDKASLAGFDRDARAANAKLNVITGAADAFLSNGQGAKAAELYKLALARADVDKAVVNTRLGIALTDAGDYAGAQAAFGAVEGPRKPIAQLWLAYIAGKLAGK